MSVLQTLTDVALQTDASQAQALFTPLAAAALAVGLASLGAGYAERGIGSASVGALAEDDSLFGRVLILTVIPETIVILALVVVFLTL